MSSCSSKASTCSSKFLILDFNLNFPTGEYNLVPGIVRDGDYPNYKNIRYVEVSTPDSIALSDGDTLQVGDMYSIEVELQGGNSLWWDFPIYSHNDVIFQQDNDLFGDGTGSPSNYSTSQILYGQWKQQ